MRDPRDDVNMCVGRKLCRSGSVLLGEYVADPDNHCWRRANVAGESVHICFARVPFEMRFADRSPQIVAAAHVMFANSGQPFRKSPLDERGEWTDWMSFDPVVAADVMRPILPGAPDQPAQPFDFSFGPCPPRLYLRQRRLHEYVRCVEAPDSLFVEETAIGILEDAVATAVACRGDGPAYARPKRRATRRAHRDACVAGAAFLVTRFEERLTLADVARSVGVAPAHFCRMFRRELGVSVHEYLTRVRLAAALDRLEDFAGRTVDLAGGLGFAGRTHFVDTLRARFGASPTLLLEQLRVARTGKLRRNPDT